MRLGFGRTHSAASSRRAVDCTVHDTPMTLRRTSFDFMGQWILQRSTIGKRILYQTQHDTVHPFGSIFASWNRSPSIGYSHDRSANIFSTVWPPRCDSVLLPRLYKLNTRTSGPTRCSYSRSHRPVFEFTVHAYVTDVMTAGRPRKTTRLVCRHGRGIIASWPRITCDLVSSALQSKTKS
jgi:hypothetical protein